MTIVNELQRIENNIANSYTALEEKGATMPTDKNSDNLASTIANLEVGGGNDEMFKSIVEGTATDIVLPDNVTKIANYFFYGSVKYPFSGKITSIKANGVTELGAYALASQDLKRIELPNLKVIGNSALSTGAGSDTAYSTVEKIILGNLEKIGTSGLNGVFNPKSAITQEVQFSLNNCEIGNSAFKYYNLPSFDGTGVKSLGYQVFGYSLAKFKKAWFPSTIETISTTSSNPMFRFAKSVNFTLYTDVTEDNIPSGWATGWNSRSGTTGTLTVIYGATYDEFLNAEV